LDTIHYIIFFSLTLQLGGLTLVRTDAGGMYLWWSGLSILETISGLVYYTLTPITLLAFSLYLALLRKEIGNISVITSIIALVSGLSWGTYYILHLVAYDLQDVAYAIMYWSLSMVLLGITFALFGIIYLRHERTTMTRLAALSFIVTGVITVLVGYVGGFTFLPWFTIYDFPWVTAIAIIPCIISLVLTLSNTPHELSRQ